LDIKNKFTKICRILEREYGIPQGTKRTDPLDVLIQTILSQNTNDRNRDLAYRRLKRQFPHWKDVLNARISTIIQAIRPGGLAGQKARRIRDILRWIKKRYGRLSLFPLKEMDSEEIKKTLGSLKGIGPKTLHCLLLFGFNREAFPVDTHILRVGKRLGFIPDGFNPEEAHQWMEPLIPQGKSLSLHLNLISFGRLICKARTPRCGICFLASECQLKNHYCHVSEL
jgi:endonuclease III